jgi:type II secretory pathway pseudopilin PulG
MKLRGQHRRLEKGHAMAALLVAMSVMSILATAAMPVWRQMAQREKEAELIFRGQQYARAIGLFQRRAGPGVNPPNLDVLVEQRFLRKKYKDPITGEDFLPISAASQAAATPGGQPGGGAAASRGQIGRAPATGRGSQGGSGPVGGAQGGIVGVASKSTQKSIRIYNGRNYYNEWAFVFVPQVQAAGGAGAQRGRGERGGPQGQQPSGARGPTAIGQRGRQGQPTEFFRVGPDGRVETSPTPFPDGRGSGRGAPPPPPQRPPGD